MLVICLIFFRMIYGHELQRQTLLASVSENEASLRTLLDALPDLVWMKSADGIYLRCNARFEDFFGAKESVILGKTDYEFVEKELADFFRANDRKAMDAGGPTLNEEEVTFVSDGHREHLETIKTPIYSSDGKVLGVLGVGRDISERRSFLEKLQKSERNLSEAQRISKLGSWELDVATGELYWSDEVYNIFGLDKDVHKNTYEAFLGSIHPEDRNSVDRAFTESIETRKPYLIQHRLKPQDGMVKYVLESGETTYTSDGPVKTMGTVQDITAKVESELQLKLLSQALDQSPVSVIITDINANVVYVNDGFETISGYSREEILGQNPRVLSSGLTAGNTYDLMWQALTAGNVYVCEIQNRRKNGDVFWEAAHFAAVADEAGEIVNYIAVKEDITQKKLQEEKIVYQANYDPVTELPNRFLCLDRLDHMLGEARRNREKVALLFFDLDDFKKVNDTLGHDVGDVLLQQVAQRVKQSLREGDTIGRLGGDEFLVMFGGVHQLEDVSPLVEKILHAMRAPFIVERRELIVTASIGVSIYPDDATPGADTSELLRKSDAAMYHSKASGRNTYTFYKESMNEKVSRRLELEEQMHGALQRQEFTLRYQPKIDLKSNRMMGVEALIRWNNPVLGSVSPQEFIALAEQTGFIEPIGRFVIESALEKMADWRRYDPDFNMAINLSPRQFRDPDLVRVIRERLTQYGLNPSAVELEITEGVLISGHEYVGDVLDSLNQLNVSIAMDDFGTGYSSLSYLRSYPFNILKIDRSFVSDIAVDQLDRELINAAVAMAHGLHLKVVAEGVETREQMEYLREINCDFAQGFYFSKPVMADEITGMLEAASA